MDRSAFFADHHSVLKVGTPFHWCLKCGSAVPRRHNRILPCCFKSGKVSGNDNDIYGIDEALFSVLSEDSCK